MLKVILMAGLLALGAAASAQVQAQVVESGTGQNQPRSAGNTAAAGNNELLISLYNQLEALQQEVQTLRGIVEEQSNRVRRLETETRARYVDMDSRLSALSAGAAIPGAAGLPSDLAAPGAVSTIGTSPEVARDVRNSAPFNPASQGVGSQSQPAAVRNQSAMPTSTQPVTGVNAEANQMSEQDLYRTALNLLLEEGKSDESAALFQTYLQRFPDGRLLPNTLYWHGEALILLSRYPEARAAFERLLKEFPADAKAAGALLKTGVVHNLQGNRSEAERIWRELPGRYPDSASEITLARDYLSRP